jgi:hypothetical protein
MFAKCIVRKEMRTGVMAFADWTDFMLEFMSTFCPENEATSALMRLELDHYLEGQRNEEAYIDKFRDLVDMSGYTDPIAIVLKFCQGLNATTQDKIAESGTDRPRDNGHQGWYAAAWQFDLNRLANEAFRYASRCPIAQPVMPRYAHAYSVFVLTSGHLVDLVPRIYICPYEAIPSSSTPSQPQEHQ